MAVSTRSVTESIKGEFLTCRICFEVYTDPRILPCLHSYCFKCICSHVDTLQAGGRPVVCPECREPFSDVVSSLKTNFFINGLTDVVKEKIDENLDCTACHLRGIDSIAKVKCLDCGDYLCSSCCDGHNASSITWKHQKIPLDVIRQGSYDDKLRQFQKTKCPKHEDKNVEYFCKPCSQIVCITCVLINHRDHECQTVPDAIKQRKASIISLTENIRENISKLDNKESDILSTLDSIKTKREVAVITIEKNAEKKIAKTITRKENSIKKVTTESLLTEKVKENELEEIRLQKGMVDSCINFCDNILEKGRDEEILMLQQMITERLGQLQSKTDDSQAEPGRNCGEQSDSTKDDQQKETLHRNNRHSKKLTTRHEQAQVMEKDYQEDSDKSSDSDKDVKQADSIEKCPTIEDVKEDKAETASFVNESAPVAELVEEIAHGTEAPFDASGNEEVNLKMSRIFMVHHQTDTTTPEIKGIAFSPQIGLVLSDKANGSIKIFTSEGVLKSCITMYNFIPFAVAIAGDIIGVISENYLNFLKASTQTVNKILIHIQKPNPNLPFTYALAATEQEFIVGNIPDERVLRVYNLDGSFNRLISCCIDFPLKSLSITHAGSYIVLCEWGSSCVKLVSWQGIVKTICSRTFRWKPNSAHVSVDDAIYVADYDLQEICVFDMSANLLLAHSTITDGILKPTGVVFDDKGRLIVAGNKGYVGVYDVEHYRNHQKLVHNLQDCG